MELTTTTQRNQLPSSLIVKHQQEIEKLKNWIKFILINKGFIFAFSLLLFFILYVVLKRYVKKRTNTDIENQNFKNNNNDNNNNNNNNNDQLNLMNDFKEFQTIVSSVINLNP